MAKDFLHAKTVSHNPNILPKLAKIYLAVQEIDREGKEYWSEDDGPMALCLQNLTEAAQRISPVTAEDCLAVLAITHVPMTNETSLDRFDRFKKSARETAVELTRNY